MRNLIQELILWPVSLIATTVVLIAVACAALGVAGTPHADAMADAAALLGYDDAADAELSREQLCSRGAVDSPSRPGPKPGPRIVTDED